MARLPLLVTAIAILLTWLFGPFVERSLFLFYFAGWHLHFSIGATF